MFEHILVPLDGSTLAECVLPHTLAIAQANESRVTLLRVLDPLGAATRPRGIDPFDWQMRKTEAEIYLKTVSSRLQKTGLSIEEEILEGDAAANVLEYANRNNVDLIILSSHGQSGISGWNVSSVVQKIIIRANKSVMIVRAYQTIVQEISALRYQRILVPLDGSQRAEYVLPVCRSLARNNQAEILLAHVVKRPEMPRRTPLGEEDLELAERIMERNRAEAASYLSDIQSRIDAPVETRLLVGNTIIGELNSLIEQEIVDLVVLSAHGYTGETKWPYGSTVIEFIVYGTTPLLVIQDLPPDLIEPTQAEIAAREHGGR